MPIFNILGYTYFKYITCEVNGAKYDVSDANDALRPLSGNPDDPNFLNNNMCEIVHYI